MTSNRTSDLSFGNCSRASDQAITGHSLRLARAYLSCGIKMRGLGHRVVYLSRIADVVYVLHCFEKKSREMPRKDFEKARQRLKVVKARLAEEKRREKHS